MTEPDPNRSNLRYVPDRWYDGVGGPRGLPLVRPHYGRVTAIDMSSGEHLWMTPHGEGPRNHPALRSLGLGRLGVGNHVAAPLVTKTLLFVTQRAENTMADLESEAPDRPAEISVYDKASGEYLGGIELQGSPGSSLVTYQIDGTQYLAVSVGGGRFVVGGGGTPPLVVALALEESGDSG